MLNKNGWGIVTALIFIAIFCICLILSAIGFRYLGLLDENWQFVKLSEIGKTAENVNYTDAENKMIEAAKKYVNENYSNLDNTLYVKYSTLVNNKYLDKIYENNKECSGYVEVSSDYKAYLKCNKYVTDGYESRRDE